LDNLITLLKKIACHFLFTKRVLNSFETIEKYTRWFIFRVQLKRIFIDNKIDVLIDVGANEGQFAKDVRNIFDGQIFSFEPVKSVFDILDKNAVNDKKWQVFNFALGSESKNATINISKHTVFSSLLKTNEYCKSAFGDKSASLSQEEILIKRLDEVLPEIMPDIQNKRIFLKIDTQGYDVEVFKGLGKYLNCVYGVQTEVSLISIYEGMKHWTEGITIFEKAGFAIVGMYSINREKNKVIEYDCLLEKV